MQQHPLTRSQLDIWLAQQLHPDAPIYNEAFTLTLHGGIEAEQFAAAFQTLVDDSDAFRTVFRPKNGTPWAYVLPQMLNALEFVDLSATPDVYEAWVDARRVGRIELEQKLFDSVLLRISAEKHVWYLCQHHIVADVRSIQISVERMAENYTLALADRLDEAPVPPQYAAYIAHEQSRDEDAARHAKAEAFWREQMSENVEPTNFYGKVASGSNRPTARRILCKLDADRSQRLSALATQKGIRSFTPHMTMLSIFSTLLTSTLNRIGGGEHIAYGTLFANRLTPQFKQTQGLFIKTLPFLVHVAESDTFRTLLDKTKRIYTSQLRYVSHPPTEQKPQLDVILNYLPDIVATQFGNIRSETRWFHPGYGDTSHALRLQVQNFAGDGQFLLYFDVNLDVFDVAAQEALQRHFLMLLDAFLDDPDRPIADISLLSEEEEQAYLQRFNDTATNYPADKTVTQLFAQQVARTPDAIAVVEEGGQSLTYAELDERSRALARYLVGRGIGRNSIIPLLLDRSIEAVVAIFGILNAGAAYAPLDPDYPDDRLTLLLNDVDPSLILTSTAHAQRLARLTDTPCVELDSQWDVIEAANVSATPSSEPDDLAYIIFTSGSTGKPKGVMVRQQGLTNYICWAQQQYCAGEKLTFPLFSSLSFDLTVTSIFVPLLTGGSLVVYGTDEAGDPAVMRVFDDNRVDIIKLTPAHLALLVEFGMSNITRLPTRIKRMIVGGEDFKTALARSVHDLYGGDVTLFNEYGPTETVVGCMIHRFDPESDRLLASVPIGTPAANTQIYVLDAQHKPTPTGVIGEMFVGGDGVARGYLKRPALSAERFIQHPSFGRVYQTGDLARWRHSGQIEFLGRADHQIKLRGYRIELGEIEARLLEHPAISECVVVLHEQSRDAAPGALHYCVRCGLPSNYPDSVFDEAGVCHMCRAYETYHDKVERYFRSEEELRAISAEIKQTSNKYDCIVLLSGGKDSTYMLYQVVELGLHPLVFSLDNGYISEGAKANMRRVTESLGLDLHWGETPHMNAIFADSLARFSNVCNGCFKTIYTLSMGLARQHGIRTIFTGLARGQLFETRLSDMYDHGIYDADDIDSYVMSARKAYHRIDDAVSRNLNVDIYADDRIFDEIQFVDFYRYVDVGLDEVMAYLRDKTPWMRPADTGRSTNCLINDVGIFVHKLERGYHNYALPYSWDVRLGHKHREAALDELDDDIDEQRVGEILDEVGYRPNPRKTEATKQLAAYIVAGDGLTSAEMRDFLSEALPDYMIPTFFVPLPSLPLTTNGKIDRRALPDPQAGSDVHFVAARDNSERALSQIWQSVFRQDAIGIHDDFFALGGDSIIAIQIVSRAAQAGLHLLPRQLFDQPTIEQLARVAESTTTSVAEQGIVTGAVPLTPIQHWLFEQAPADPNFWNHALTLEIAEGIDQTALEQALQALVMHHDALRLSFKHEDGVWQQKIQPNATIELIITSEPVEMESTRWNASLNIETGELVRAVLCRAEDAPDQLLLIVHHLAVDAVSWLSLVEDLETAYNQIVQNRTIKLPAKTTSFKQWAEALAAYAKQPHDLTAWQGLQGGTDETDYGVHEDTAIVTASLNSAETTQLLREANGAYNTQINDLLLTALVRTMDDTSLRVDLEGHGREPLPDSDSDIDLARTVGWFTTLSPLSLQQADSLVDQITHVKETVRAMPNKGLDYGVLRYMGDPATQATLRDVPPASVLFNYLGQVSNRGTGRFRVQGRVEGIFGRNNPRTYPLELIPYVHDDQLHIELHYNSMQSSQWAMGDWVDRYVSELRTVIEHCLDPSAGTVTASDFDLAGLDQAGLSQLADVLTSLDE